ncbi:MAG: AAA family ATPase, partial [Acidobacteria bacterium]|nr:AAA family ATPase [Acidobacteriota bacterium]
MLQHLHIESYALIESLDLEFQPGFNLLTGETGSGKSIIVDAVGLLLGKKASAEMIRGGEARARISAVFSFPPAPASGSAERWLHPLNQLLAEAGLANQEDEDLILQRDIMLGGKSRTFVNHQPATVAMPKSLAPFLTEVHGQTEQQE